jgi:hypothetical protein
MSRAKPYDANGVPCLPPDVRSAKDTQQLQDLKRHIDAVKAMKLRAKRRSKPIQFKMLSEKYRVPVAKLKYSARDLTASLDRLQARHDMLFKATAIDKETAVSIHKGLRRKPQALSLRSAQRYCKLPRQRRIQVHEAHSWRLFYHHHPPRKTIRSLFPVPRLRR